VELAGHDAGGKSAEIKFFAGRFGSYCIPPKTMIQTTHPGFPV